MSRDETGCDHPEEANNNSSSSSNYEASKMQVYFEVEPLEREPKPSPRSVYLCTVAYSLLQAVSIVAFFGLIALLLTRFYYITLIYGAYLLLDRNTCNNGGRRIDLVWRSAFWRNLAGYFPIRLRQSRSFNLSKEENYILNYHPHGISAFGAVSAFATNGINFGERHPGIVSRFMVHETSFLVPIMREVFLFRGDCSVNSKSIDHMLTKRGRGNLLCLVGGGLAEADLSHQQVLKIVVAQRKGFVKKALMHGAHLIPCIGFGENSVFNKVDLEEDSLLQRLESKWYKLLKFKHPIYYGRSFFSRKRKGIMPYMRPITVVMGDPIKVERVPNPSQAQVDQLHSRYMDQLLQMYNSNRDLCSEFDREIKLV